MACSPVLQRVNQRRARALTKVFPADCCKKNSAPFSIFLLTDGGVDTVKLNRLFELQDVVMFPQGL